MAGASSSGWDRSKESKEPEQDAPATSIMKTSDIHIRDPYILPLPEEGRYLLFGTTGRNAWSGAGTAVMACCSGILKANCG